jgi:hypothetical protein
MAMTRTTILWLGGSLLIFAGERIFGTGTLRWVLDCIGVLFIVTSVGLRFGGLKESEVSRAKAHKLALGLSAIGIAGFVCYALSLDVAIDVLAMDESGAQRWRSVWKALCPMLWLIGTVSSMLVDLSLAANPAMLPHKSAHHSALNGLSTALVICLVFPINYIANDTTTEWDAAYFRVTRAGQPTLSAVQTLPEPINITLFFPAGNEVVESVRPYFTQLQDQSNGLISVQYADQALNTVEAEELKIRENGYIVFQGSGSPEKLKLSTDMNKGGTRAKLKKLDTDVLKLILKVSRGDLVAYMLTGHREASARTKDDPFRKIALLKTGMTQLGYKVKSLGLGQGSAEAVPEDADLVLIFDPVDPITESEVDTLKSYADGGGSLFIITTPDGDPMTNLLAHLGLTRSEGMLADMEQRGRSPHQVLTDRYSTHATVKVLSDYKTVMALVRASALKKSGEIDAKHTALIRTHSSTFLDLNVNGSLDAEEKKQVYNAAYAVESNESKTEPADEGKAKAQTRAVVVGTLAPFSDPAARVNPRRWIAGQFFADSLKWLTHEDAIIGETANEEDILIEHTPQSEKLWFWSTMLAMPLLILTIGGVQIATRRRRK